jgi:photosystem II stability/assembly factor-like uncharacterized protein
MAFLVASLASSTSAAQPVAARGAYHWTDRSGDLPLEPLTAVATDPFDDRVVWVGSDGFVFRSDDGGESYVAVLSFPRGLADEDKDDTSAASLDGIAASTTNTDVLVAPTASAPLDLDDDDDGDDDELPDGAPSTRGAIDDDPVDDVDLSVPARVEAGVRSFAFVPGSRGVVLVATPRGLFRSLDSGGAFTRLELPGGARENDVRDVAIDPQFPTRMYVATAAGLFLSRDGGVSFSRGPGRTATVPGVCFSVTATNGTTQVLYGTELGLLRSRDRGESFTDLLLRGAAAFPVIHSVAHAPSTKDAGDITYAGTSLGLFAAERGAPILERYTGMPADAPTSIAFDPLEPGGVAIALRAGNQGVLFSDDIGLSVVHVDNLPAQQAFSLARGVKDPKTVWVATDRGLFHLEPGTGISLARDDAKGLRERFSREPSLNGLTLTALKRRGLSPTDDHPLDRVWWAALLPRIDARYTIDVGDNDERRLTFLFRDPSTLPAFTDPNFDNNDLFGDGVLIFSPRQKIDNSLWVTFTWDLDRLVMNPVAMSVARQIPVRANAVRDVVDRVQSLYVARRRLVAELYVAPRRATEAQKRERVGKELRLLEVEAQLAALVGRDAFDPEDTR